MSTLDKLQAELAEANAWRRRHVGDVFAANVRAEAAEKALDDVLRSQREAAGIGESVASTEAKRRAGVT